VGKGNINVIGRFFCGCSIKYIGYKFDDRSNKIIYSMMNK